MSCDFHNPVETNTLFCKTMKKGKIAILIGVGICLLALVMYPVLRHAWDMHCLDAKARCLVNIYRAITDKAVESESTGQEYSWPRTLSEMLDETAKAELKRKGVDWRQILYNPVSDDSPDTSIVLSLESGEYIIKLLRNGVLFRGRKKYAEV